MRLTQIYFIILMFVLATAGCQEAIVDSTDTGLSEGGDTPEPVDASVPDGAEVFFVNPGGEAFDNMYSLSLVGQSSSEVYVVATNTNAYEVETATIERLGTNAAVQPPSAAVEVPPRSVPGFAVHESPRIANNPARQALPVVAVASRAAVTEGARYAFSVPEPGTVPATARKVVTDGRVTLAMWVADESWSGSEKNDACSGQCVRPAASGCRCGSVSASRKRQRYYDWVTRGNYVLQRQLLLAAQEA